jgi:carbon-monoxide dehydrogenase large subunit
MFEEAVYDENGTLADYLVPSAADLPSFATDRTETPATTNPLGVQGVGKAGTIASTPAVVNAVVDAVRHFGVTDIPMPCSPQRVWRAVQSARGAVKSTSEHNTGAAAGGGLGSIDAQGGGR